jgi:hypothetical protein
VCRSLGQGGDEGLRVGGGGGFEDFRVTRIGAAVADIFDDGTVE